MVRCPMFFFLTLSLRFPCRFLSLPLPLSPPTAATVARGFLSVASVGQAGLLQHAEQMTRAIPWEETLTVCDVPLELEDVHDDLRR